MSEKPNLIPISRRDEPNLLDWSIVEDEIKAHSSGDGDRSKAFIEFALDALFDRSSTLLSFWITDGGNDRGIDAVVIDDSSQTIHFLNTKCVQSSAKSKHNFPSSEVDKALRFLDEYLEKSAALLKCNLELADAVQAGWDRLENSHYGIHLHLCSNQTSLTPEERHRLGIGLQAKRILLHEHHLIAFASGKTRPTPPVTRSITFIAGAKIERTLGKVRTVSGYVTVASLANFLKGQDGRLDDTLFFSNVRAFLGAKTSVNDEIAKTLLSSDRGLFECFNNGLKLVCEAIIGVSGAFPVRLTNPQILNGLQTANVIFEFALSRPTEAAETSVFIQITETSDRSVANKIALASNNQQRIGTRDLRANDDVQIRIERELAKRGYGYVRKQGQTHSKHGAQVIDSLSLGQIIVSYELFLPEKAKTQTDSIFGDMYDEVFNPKLLTADRIITLNSLYALVNERKKLAKVKQRRISRGDYSEEWIIEGIFHVLLAVRRLCETNGLDPYSLEDAKSQINDAIDLVSDLYAESKSSAYRYFRLAATRTAVQERCFMCQPSIGCSKAQYEFDL
ncbi:MAG: hypothetical protein GC166_06750 [Alphaproteobacteria bacterium]|nr:hypothetical protein [Alphaproteobacteria bacterium]